MPTLVENNVIRFLNITRKKSGLFANFKVLGIRGGVSFKASFTVDLSAAQVDPADSLEKIIEECAQIAVREFKLSDLQFEGVAAV